MKFTYFKFENFKGIEQLKIDLSGAGKIYPLVGLNESGKTSILEAINYFIYKNDKLHVGQIGDYVVSDVHDLIPIGKRANFNGKILIEAGLVYSESDKDEIRKEFLKHGIQISEIGEGVNFSQYYVFENSKYIKEKSTYHWVNSFHGKPLGKKGKNFRIKNEDALKVIEMIKSKIPSILYFPNFLFEFPERIYLAGNVEDQKHLFYQKVMQDILDAVGGSLDLQAHVVSRMGSTDRKDRDQLRSVVGKAESKLTEVIFEKWSSILGRRISAQGISLEFDSDSKGPYVEFFIREQDDSYRLSERSLGFRWFFVFILLTQFRTFRGRSDKNAIFLFDEPASNLHPSAQKELLESFSRLDSVIYTTHSHYMINPRWLETTYVVKNEGIDYSNEQAFSSRKTSVKAYKYREFSNLHPDQTSYFQPIIEVLAYKPSDIELVPNALIAEGKNDFYAIEFARRILGENFDFSVIPATGSGSFDALVALYIGWGRNFLTILDGDREGEKQKAAYEEKYGQIIEGRVFTLADVSADWAGYEMEDLFSCADRLCIQAGNDPVVPKFNKKVFNRRLQEIIAADVKLSADDETRANFSRLVEFLSRRLGSKIS